MICQVSENAPRMIKFPGVYTTRFRWASPCLTAMPQSHYVFAWTFGVSIIIVNVLTNLRVSWSAKWLPQYGVSETSAWRQTYEPPHPVGSEGCVEFSFGTCNHRHCPFFEMLAKFPHGNAECLAGMSAVNCENSCSVESVQDKHAHGFVRNREQFYRWDCLVGRRSAWFSAVNIRARACVLLDRPLIYQRLCKPAD